jgi:hypothetical protein
MILTGNCAKYSRAKHRGATQTQPTWRTPRALPASLVAFDLSFQESTPHASGPRLILETLTMLGQAALERSQD